MNKTMVAVAIFIVFLIAAMYATDASSQPRIALGHTFEGSRVTVGEVSYEHKNWELSGVQFGQGWTKKGERSEPITGYSVSRLIRPQWCLWSLCNYYRLGVSHIPDAMLVGDNNYRLGTGFETEVFAIEYFHYSSAGISKPNTGIDGFMLRLKL